MGKSSLLIEQVPQEIHYTAILKEGVQILK